MVQAHLAGTEILNFPVVQSEVVDDRENPWTEFIGMYEGDADFAASMAELRAERGLEPLLKQDLGPGLTSYNDKG